MAARKKTNETVEEVVLETVEEVVETPVIKEAPAAKAEQVASLKPEKKADKTEVIFESTHQLGIFSDYIYNARNYDVDIVVENMGYGDVYVNERGLAKVGDITQRLSFGESRTFKATSRVYAASASQPVIQILELK